MEQKLDLRIQKTYIALTNAFFQMMEEIRFEDIRVKDLCERAMVRKSTFYKHFADKYELLAFIVKEMQRKFDAQLANEDRDTNKADYYTQLLSLIFDFIDANRRFVQSAISSNSFPLILNILSEQVIPDIRLKLKEDERHGESLPADENVMATFFVGGIMESVGDWLVKGMPITRENLMNQLSGILRRFMR